jgi:hypothetical protein
MQKAAVVIPLHRLPLTREEEISLSRLRRVLGEHPRYFVSPPKLHIPTAFLQGEKVLRFGERYFTYPVGYNRLLMTAGFYKAFGMFKHILIYQLDCLVFRDELEAWCARDYDFIGAPWRDDYSAQPGTELTWKVGNGGFSLRKVSTAQAILGKRIKRGRYFPIPPASLPKPGFSGWLITNFRNRIKQHLNLWTVEDELGNFTENEDRFWAVDVLRIDPEYRMPRVEEALKFAFEIEPRLCLEKTQGAMPFGCHAWWKHDRSFWESALAGMK